MEQHGIKKLLNVREMADLLGVKVSWIYQRTRLGQTGIPHIFFGKYIRFNPEEVMRFFQEKRNREV